MISEDVIQRIKEENDIVDLISESVKLRRAGRSYIGLCPFHHEKSPSFSVSQDKQIYKCFGCGEAGNVMTFVMKTRNMTFPEAVQFLAERANIELILQKDKNDVHKNAYDNLYTLNVEAARYFFNCLKNDKNAKNYFLNRGITEGTIRKFGLGYSVNNWEGLLKHMKSKGFTQLDMLAAGLIVKGKNDSFYDRFRHRVMFPVFNYKGKVIGFGGRVLDDSKPKYLNSPETPLFKKGINLYGLNFAIKGNINKTLIIVEGYMDCISLHQYGITNAVASLGTALTSNQARLMKRYAERVIISYDSDAAGQMATLRGLDILKKTGLDVRVLTVPEGKDPDEFIRNNGRDAFLKLVNEALPVTDYTMKSIKEKIDVSNSEGVITYVEQVLDMLIGLDPIEREVYIKGLSEETKIREEALYEMLKRKIQKNVKNDENVNTHGSFGQKLYLEPAYLKGERGLLKLMFENREALFYIKENIQEDILVLDSHKKIYEYIVESCDYEKDHRKNYIESKCSDIQTSKEWINILETEVIYSDNDYKTIINDYVKGIKKYKLEESKKDIMNKIKKYEKEGKFEESLKLAQELVTIQKKIGGIQ